MTLNPPSARPRVFEGYGPGGAVILIECLTDDPGRMRALLRATFREHGGFLGAEGAVSYLFDRVGWIRYAAGVARTVLAQAAYAAGAEDVIDVGGGGLEVRTDPEDFESVRLALARQGWVPLAAGVTERPALTVPLEGDAARQFRELLGALAGVDGVGHVYSNVEIPEAILAGV